MPTTTRREFLRYGSAAAVSSFGGWTYLLSLAEFLGAQVLGFFGGIMKLPPRPKPWEIVPGVVDYRIVAQYEGPMNSRGVPQAYLDDPTKRILNVAQWYDSWPGYVIRGFTDYMAQTFDLPGCEVRWTSNIYLSNEELYSWIAREGRRLDLMVPTNHMVERMEKEGFLVNLNKDWIPNYVNLFGPVPTPIPEPRSDLTYQSSYPQYPNGYNNPAAFDFRSPALNGFAYRIESDTYPNPRGSDRVTWDEKTGLLAVPYQSGTTGIGYRTDIFRRQDIEALGWDVFGLTEYENPDTGVTHHLTRKLMLLSDVREGFTAGLKDTGWKRQAGLGLSPTAIPHLDSPPYNGEYQWSSNEVSLDKLVAARDWLLSVRPNLWGFNTAQQGPWLVTGTVSADQAWSGDIMYAIRPASNQHTPVDYIVPKQGSTRWVDCLVVHRESEKLWLDHQFINYLHDPAVQAMISGWTVYATPNAWAFELMHNDPSYTYVGQNLDGSPYRWNPTEDPRIYADLAFGYRESGGAPILERCEYHKDLGPVTRESYELLWGQVSG